MKTQTYFWLAIVGVACAVGLGHALLPGYDRGITEGRSVGTTYYPKRSTAPAPPPRAATPPVVNLTAMPDAKFVPFPEPKTLEIPKLNLNPAPTPNLSHAPKLEAPPVIPPPQIVYVPQPAPPPKIVYVPAPAPAYDPEDFDTTEIENEIKEMRWQQQQDEMHRRFRERVSESRRQFQDDFNRFVDRNRQKRGF